MSSTPRLKALSKDNINPHICSAQYAVRGELAIKSEEYRSQLKSQSAKQKGPPTPPSDTDEQGSLPFDTVISANIGNPQQLDQKPITFFRQVLALLENPKLLEHSDVLESTFGYPKDAIARAQHLLSEIGSVGAYSQSAGAPAIRQSVANFIKQRDGFDADPKNIYLSAGASSGVNTLLHIICSAPNTGVLVPIPQYPLYTATLSVLNARCVPYYLDEQKSWGTSLEVIKESYERAIAEGTDVKAIVVINPGNPTGASLSEADIQSVIRFAAERQLVVMADEVYQTNVFIGQFHSFKSVLRKMQRDEPETFDHVELASLHSISKGMVGECGHRGGYFELIGFDQEVVAQIFKFISIVLCPPVIGQCLVELMVNPPKQGDPSYELYNQEYNGIKEGLRERATALYKAFKDMEGVEVGEPQVCFAQFLSASLSFHTSTPPPDAPTTPLPHPSNIAPKGSMYLFPTIHLPEKAISAAHAADKNPDDFYCLRLLDATGICVVPGSGFGQVPGTLHLRTTFLAPGTEWVGRWTRFHAEFMDKYRD